MKIIVKIDSSIYPIISNFVVSKMGACRQVLCKMLNLPSESSRKYGSFYFYFCDKSGKKWNFASYIGIDTNTSVCTPNGHLPEFTEREWRFHNLEDAYGTTTPLFFFQHIPKYCSLHTTGCQQCG